MSRTALVLACEKSNIQAVETLITKGADPTLRDNKGCDALYYTSLSKDDSLRRLVQAALDRRKNNGDYSQKINSSPIRHHPHQCAPLFSQDVDIDLDGDLVPHYVSDCQRAGQSYIYIQYCQHKKYSIVQKF